MDVAIILLKKAFTQIGRRNVRSFVSVIRNRFLPSLFETNMRQQKLHYHAKKRFCSMGSKTMFDVKDREQGRSSETPSCYSFRTHTCGELTSWHEGCKVVLFGWIEFIRHDKFIVLRDAYGSTQILISDMSPSICKATESLNVESVVSVEGTVVLRPPEQINPRMLTGEVEVAATNITILASAPKKLPFNIRKFQNPTELLAMKYRYLYFRYPHMQMILRTRSTFLHNIREFLIQKHFVDVETPTLFCRTPGGAQEFVVPTQSPGLFYSLVQSPQQFKQLLMVGGLDRYFQIARCYRDEGSRPDRQPEFTQLDIELSFVDREGVISLIEDLLLACWPDHLKTLSTPFHRVSFSDALSWYGSDKPDMRFDSKILDLTHLFESAESEEAQHVVKENGFSVQAVVFPNAASVSNRDQWVKMQNQAQEEWQSPNVYIVPVKQIKDIRKALGCFASKNSLEEMISFMKVQKGDLLIFGLGPRNTVLKMLGAMRVGVADWLEAQGHPVRLDGYHFAWILDFPLFEEGADGLLESAHHPFTQPHPEDIHLLNSEPLRVRGLHYDLVLNGAEVGGGSIRISNAELQKDILHQHLHIKTDTLQHLLDALSMGCPPHGGIALGIDRLVASICGAKSIREVIAFPKGSNGQDIMSHAPSPLSEEDAKLYGLSPVTNANVK